VVDDDDDDDDYDDDDDDIYNLCLKHFLDKFLIFN